MKINNYQWFYHRLQSMSIPEIGYRTGQFIQKKTDKRQAGWKPTLAIDTMPETLFPYDPAHAPASEYTTHWEIFNHEIDFSAPIDWHLDISTGNRFPLTYAKEINTRTDRFGSAKYVWEINRLQFLPSLAIQYKRTGDIHFLAQFVSITESWVQANPYLIGVNWYSNIEINIRLINWFICWNILDASELMKTDATFGQFVKKSWLPSIYQHCVYSRRNPSHYSSANNHLVSEYAGLFVASVFWDFPESAEWESYSRRGLETEIKKQHSANGINKEEAAEYIQFITDLFLIPFAVARKIGRPFTTSFAAALELIVTYIANFLDVQGNFPQYGDEDDGRIVCLYDKTPYNNFRSILASGALLYGNPIFKQYSHGFDLKNYILFGEQGRIDFDKVPDSATRLSSAHYANEGHFIFRKQGADESEIYLHFDAAPLGFLSIAAHGHADALSFLLHVDGKPLFVDSGTYTYHTEPDWRNYFVSTRAHNTVCIDGLNQAYQAGGLLWLNHYTSTVHMTDQQESLEMVSASHNGYASIGCHHRRAIEFDRAHDQFTIRDFVRSENADPHTLEVFFHLHPQAIVTALTPGKLLIRHPDGNRQVVLQIDLSLTVDICRGQTEPAILGWYSERFYRKQETTTIRASRPINEKGTTELIHQISVHSLN
ncbi:alginate lyase family protein [Fibrivirga algicola]|uniref:Heparin-sulfate lyase N-terminal domain-containing protein n=1 Tax=Fibrivirga algicola TaxID=2950420 RepID=A0ABX0QN46_9BACT|nr:alginate lyase family protein [Fibrivirga algicola]NID12287.1 hypothetical protein [Fibrivirga algicola]